MYDTTKLIKNVKIFRHYANILHAIRLRHFFEWNFANSIFPATSFNFGPCVYCLDHLDNHNLAYGLCHIHSLGRYNPKKGGHLILFDLKLVVEFPPNSSVLIPSTSLRHGNVPVSPDEICLSFMQYCAGSLMRWVRYGFSTFKRMVEENPQLAKEVEAEHPSRWATCLGLFSKLTELVQDRHTVFG
jgi:hypothetical protein